MIRPMLFVSILALASPEAAPRWVVSQQQQAPASDVGFTVTRAPDGTAQLGLSFDDGETRGTYSKPYAWASLAGLDASSLDQEAGRPVRFTIDRPAGRLVCSGQTAARGPTGRCEFEPDQGFAADLRGRTGEHPQFRHLLHLALSELSPADLDEWTRLGYPQPNLDDITEAAIHEVDGPYASSMAQAGYRLDDLDALTAFRVHGVTADDVRSLTGLGPAFRDLPAEDVMALSLHRVTPNYVRGLAEAGLPSLLSQELVALKTHEVTAESVRDLTEAGYASLSLDDRLAFAVHGIDAAFIRQARQAGHSDLSPDRLVSLRIHAPEFGGSGLQGDAPSLSAPDD